MVYYEFEYTYKDCENSKLKILHVIVLVDLVCDSIDVL